MAHDAVSLSEQMSFWYSIDRYLDSKKIKNTSNIFLENYLLDRNILDHSISKQYDQQFIDIFSRFFGHTVDENVRISDRLRSSICVFHSLAYKLHKRFASFRECVYNPYCSKLTCFGEIIFFFRHSTENFFLFKQMPCSSSLFLKYFVLDNHVSSRADRIHQYFYTDCQQFFYCFTYLSLFFLFFINALFFHLMGT